MEAMHSRLRFYAASALFAVTFAIPSNGVSSTDPIEAVFEGFGELIFRVEKRFERERALPFAVTQPVTSQADALEILKEIDGFLLASTETPSVVYLPIHLSGEETSALGEPSSSECWEGYSSSCTRAFFTREMVVNLYTQGSLGSDVSRALTNFIRELNARENNSASAVTFSKALPLLSRDYGSNPQGPYGVVHQDARDNARREWFADPCNQVTASGRDDGWSQRQDEAPQANDVMAALRTPCAVSDEGSGTKPLGASELEQFARSTRRYSVAIKNQPPPALRGWPSGYRGKDLSRMAAEAEYPIRYIRYTQHQPSWRVRLLTNSAAKERALESVNSEDRLSPFERRFMRRLLVDAARSLPSRGSAAVKMPRNTRLVLGEGDFYDIGVAAENARFIEFPVAPVRVSFMNCEAEIAALIGFTRSEAECRAFGGQPRQFLGGWPTANIDPTSAFREQQEAAPKSATDEAKDRGRRFVCQAANDPERQLTAVNRLNSCIVDQLWFLVHHELAHIYRGTAGKPNMSEDQADCHGLLRAIASRPNAGLGVFESDIASKAERLLLDNPQTYGAQSRKLLGRLEGLQKQLTPMAAQGSLTVEACRKYTAPLLPASGQG